MWKIAAFAAPCVIGSRPPVLTMACKGESTMRKVFWSVAVAMVAGSFWLGRLSADEKPKTRLFELRTYTANEGKLDALQARFRDHTVKLFEKHGMTNVGYWTPEGERSKDTLIYILAFPDKEARNKAFKEFSEDPEWKKAQAESEANGKLLKKAPESVFLNPTDYSPMK